MGREIVTERDVQRARTQAQAAGGIATGGPASATEKADSYTERLLKYIPAEVIALYVLVAGAIRAAESAPGWLAWAVFVLMMIGTPLYLNKVQGVAKKLQLLIATGAFAVWVFSLGDQSPFTQLSWYLPIYPTVLLPLYTFFAAIVKPESKNA